MKNKIVFDLETNGLLDTVTDVWCMGIDSLSGNGSALCFERNQIALMLQADVIIGHNIIGYDLPVLKKIYGFAPKKGSVIIDTLVLSRLLCRDRKSHSLDSWGKTLGFPKGDHSDWTKYTPEMGEYCKRDVDLNVDVYHHLRELSNES